MEVARYDSSGGTITATITCSDGREGAYTLFLWAAASNDVLMQERGNFINHDDDTYELPGPLTAASGRLVEALVTIARGPCVVSLELFQDGSSLAQLSQRIPKGSVGRSADLFVQLEAMQ